MKRQSWTSTVQQPGANRPNPLDTRPYCAPNLSPVQKHLHHDAAPAFRHQKISSISIEPPRSTIRNSNPSAAMMVSNVASLVPASPFSSDEIVATRKLILRRYHFVSSPAPCASGGAPRQFVPLFVL